MRQYIDNCFIIYKNIVKCVSKSCIIHILCEKYHIYGLQHFIFLLKTFMWLCYLNKQVEISVLRKHTKPNKTCCLYTYIRKVLIMLLPALCLLKFKINTTIISARFLFCRFKKYTF